MVAVRRIGGLTENRAGGTTRRADRRGGGKLMVMRMEERASMPMSKTEFWKFIETNGKDVTVESLRSAKTRIDRIVERKCPPSMCSG